MGLPLPFKNIENSRSYLYIENLIDLILKIINEDKFLNKNYFVSDGIRIYKIFDRFNSKTFSKKPKYFKCKY